MTILLNKNLIEFGYTIPPSKGIQYNKYLIWIKYDCCGKENKITWGSYNKTIRKKNRPSTDKFYWCSKCWSQTKEGRSSRSIQAKKMWSDNYEELCKLHKKIACSENGRIQRSKQSLKAWNDENYRNKQLKRITRMFKSCEHRELVSNRNKKLWLDPNYRVKALSGLGTPESERKRILAQNTDEYINNQRNKALERFKNIDYKARIAKGIANYGGKPSKPELIVMNMLDELNITYEFQYNIGPYVFDFFIPDNNLLIEVQGDYWHLLPVNSKRDERKASYIRNNFKDLKLISIWEHQLSFKDKVVELIKYHTGISKLELIEFKLTDLVINKIDKRNANNFLDVWHYGSHGRSGGHCYAALLDDNIVIVCKFTTLSRQNIAQSIDANNPIELSRMAVNPKYQVKNLISYSLARMIPLIKAETSCDVIISYSDTTYNHYGSSYKASNFVIDKIVPIDYHYVDDDGWVCGKKRLYNRAIAAHMKESEFANKFGYAKVYGHKKYRWIYKFKS